MSRSKGPKRINPGSFLEICLAPGYYTYARKAEGITSVAFYDGLATMPNHDLKHLEQQELLLITSVLDTMPWSVIGCIPLPATWPLSTYSWDTDPLSEPGAGQQNAGSFEVQYLLIETKKNPATGAIEVTERPVESENLRGIPRRTIYWPSTIEDILRAHYGITMTGDKIAPIHIKNQFIL